MRKHGLEAFWIALVLYLPVVLLFVRLQSGWEPPEEGQKQGESLFPIGFLSTPAPSVVAAEKAPLKEPSPAKTPPAPAVSGETETQEPKNAIDEPVFETLTPQELSDAFAPDAGPQTKIDRPAKEDSGIVPATELGDLYGMMLFELTEAERRFLENQLGPIGAITQRYLRYPSLAGQLRMSGETVVAFTLLPGGDITPIEIIKSSGYSLLDDNAVHTVQIAHKDYPHPKEPVRIRMRVFYRLF